MIKRYIKVYRSALRGAHKDGVFVYRFKNVCVQQIEYETTYLKRSEKTYSILTNEKCRTCGKFKLISRHHWCFTTSFRYEFSRNDKTSGYGVASCQSLCVGIISEINHCRCTV